MMMILIYTIDIYDAVRAHASMLVSLMRFTGRIERLEAAMRMRLREARNAFLDIANNDGHDDAESENTNRSRGTPT